MARMHEKRAEAGADSREADEEGGAPDRRTAQLLALRDMRGKLKAKATEQFKTTVETALLIVRQMINTDARDEAMEELEPHVAATLASGLIDHIRETLVDQVGEALGLAEHFSSVLLGSFDAAREFVKGQVEARGKVTAAEVADSVINGAFAAMTSYCDKIGPIIDGLPAETLLMAYRSVASERRRADPDDDELREGLEERALERMVGIQTGGAAMHTLAVTLYSEYQAQVRQAKPVREQVDEIQSLEADPGQNDRKARAAEAKMSDQATGEGLGQEIKKDEYVRGRVAEEAP